MNSLSLVFETLDISGLMSFPPNVVQKLNLNTGRLTAIIGENLDKGDGERNGVGKTAIIDALLYVYFGRTPRMNNQELVNKIEPGAVLVIGTARRNGICFRVERGENPSVLRLFEKPENDSRDIRHKEDGKFVFETTKSKPETTKRIVELIGFDLKLADVLLVNSSGDKSCYFLKTEDEQRTIIERVFGFTVFTEKADRLRELRKEENKNLATKESAMIATKQANDRVLTRIADLDAKSTAWAAENDKLFRFLTQQIATYDKIDFDHDIDVLSQADQFLRQTKELERDRKTHQEHSRQLQSKQARWNTDRVQQSTTLTNDIEALQKVDADTEIEIIQRKLELEQQISNATTEHAAAQRERTPYQEAIEAASGQRVRLVKQIAALEQEIIQLNECKCPTCGQDWADTQDHIVKSIEELDRTNDEIEAIDKQMLDLRTKIKKLSSQADKLKMKLTGLMKQMNGLPETVFQTVEEARKASTSVSELSAKLETLSSLENPHNTIVGQTDEQIVQLTSAIETVYASIKSLPGTYFADLAQAIEEQRNLTTLREQLDGLKNTENPYRKTIDDLRNETLQPVDETEVRDLKRKVDHLSCLIILLSDRDSPIRKAVMNEWMPELNHRLNMYLTSLELDHRGEFDTNMTATFTKKGKVYGYSNLSKGQRLRVWQATNRAMREIFEMINYPVNLFFVDELLDNGLSTRGSEVAYQLLEEMAQQGKSVFLMTHKQELLDASDAQITVILENELSRLE